MKRAPASDKLSVYLSCPIGRGAGSFASTSVEIAEFTAVGAELGHRVRIFDPAICQLGGQ